MAIKDGDGSEGLSCLPGSRCDSVAELLQLLGGDVQRLLRIIEPYQQIANDTLLDMDAALRHGNVEQLRAITHEMAMACYLVGQKETAHRMEAISQAHTKAVVDPVMVQCVARAREALLESIVHMELEIARLKQTESEFGRERSNER